MNFLMTFFALFIIVTALLFIAGLIIGIAFIIFVIIDIIGEKLKNNKIKKYEKLMTIEINKKLKG